VYPVIYDSKGIVLSLPPIINGNHSKITLNTKNVLIECTATDLTRANTALNILVTAFSEYCSPKYTIEQIEVFYEENSSSKTYPTFDRIPIDVDLAYAKKLSTIDSLTCENIIPLLKRMCLTAKVKDDSLVSVEIPPYRPDILHACDIVEDIIISYGLNNIPMEPPKIGTVGKQLPISKVGTIIRQEFVQAGYNECLTLSLMSKIEAYQMMRMPFNQAEAVLVANPKTVDNEMVRNSLIPGLLKFVFSNKDEQLPIKIFEMGDIVVKSTEEAVGAKNIRMLCLLIADMKSHIEILQGVLEMLMMKMGMKLKHDYAIKLSSNPKYLDGCQVDITLKNDKLGEMGVIHPEILKNFGIILPCTVMELNFEKILSVMMAK